MQQEKHHALWIALKTGALMLAFDKNRIEGSSVLASLSIVTTFHSEGLLAHQTLLALSRCMDAAGDCEIICVLDRADKLTHDVVRAFADKRIRIIETAHGDLGLARNSGIAESESDFIAITDGDDYYSREWLVRGRSLVQSARDDVVAHPEFVVSFGDITCFAQQEGQDSSLFDRDSLLCFNPWVSCCIARRDLFLTTPYRQKMPGIGFEDWNFHCDTIARGIVHKIAPQTAVYYRRKANGMHSQESAHFSVVGSSPLFAKTAGAQS